MKRRTATDVSSNDHATRSKARKRTTEYKDEKADEPRTIDELISARANESETKDEPIFSYPTSGTAYVDYTPAQLNQLAEHAASHYSSIVPCRLHSSDPVEVIAVLGPSTFEYFISLLALSKLGHTVLLVSSSSH